VNYEAQLFGWFSFIRAVHFGACLLVFGVFAFDRFIVAPIQERGTDLIRLWLPIARALTGLALPVALLSGAAWFAVVAIGHLHEPLIREIRLDRRLAAVAKLQRDHAVFLAFEEAEFLHLLKQTAVRGVEHARIGRRHSRSAGDLLDQSAQELEDAAGTLRLASEVYAERRELFSRALREQAKAMVVLAAEFEQAADLARHGEDGRGGQNGTTRRGGPR